MCPATRASKAGLESGVDVELRRYDGPDRMMKPVVDTTRLRSYTRQRSVKPRVIADIADWLRSALGSTTSHEAKKHK
jgi:hypothetical protein